MYRETGKNGSNALKIYSKYLIKSLLLSRLVRLTKLKRSCRSSGPAEKDLLGNGRICSASGLEVAYDVADVLVEAARLLQLVVQI